MLKALLGSWALLLGMGLINLGHGLQGSLLGVRASIEGFETTVTGLVMSGYYMGLIVGSKIVPNLVAKVGHIRVFGAVASLASTSILVQAIFVDPFTWWAMRLITGLSYAGIYIVAESWLNEVSENDTRGQLLSFYMLVSLSGLSGGQMLLNVASPSSHELFVLISLMVSLAVIPILITATKAPPFEVQDSVSMLQLYQVAPIGVFGMLITGMVQGTIFGMGAVYTSSIGLSVKYVSFFMGALILGGFLSQYPLGWISDRVGRRMIIIGSCTIGAFICFFASTNIENELLFFGIAAVVGGVTMPLYSLCSAQTNDYLSPEQMVAASGTLVLVNAIGAFLGTLIVALTMDLFGSTAFYGSIGVMLTIIAGFTIIRVSKRSDIPVEDRGEFVVMTPTPFSVSLTPEVELEEIEAAASADPEEIQKSFEELANELKS
ncbi:MAG: MFS transporter [Proteobacteria bacterium]|nr:MFS transporter [Pseudomonadota bacterium]